MSILTSIREKYHPIHRLRKLGWFRRFQDFVDFPVTIRNGRIRQRVYWLRDIGFVLLRDKLEEQTAKSLESLVALYAPTLFLDVGANVGFYSWRVRNLRPSTAIWMFEPDRSNGRLLRSTMQENAMQQVRLIQAAVSDRIGDEEFLLDPVSGKTGSLVDNHEQKGSLANSYGLAARESVKCLTLDSLMDEMRGARILLKMDVEGAEDRALAGARGVLRELRPVIILECFDIARMEWLRRDLGYEIHDLHEKGNYLLLPAELHRLSSVLV